MFCLMCINKLNGVDEFAYEVWYTTECNVGLGCNANNFACGIKLSIYRIIVMKGYRLSLNTFFL